MSPATSPDSPRRRRIPRAELWLVAAIVLVGAVLRVAWPSRMAVEHFDEGVYASNVWFGPSDDPRSNFRHPDQHLYAPPLLPTLIEWVFTFLGPSNIGAMLPSLAAGCLTVPLVWWVGRRWFGPAVGVAAATLAALCDAHVVFSRTALTDVLLCLWLLLAVYFQWEALTTARVWPAIAAGVATGLAWWTKYTGWLPLAIGLAGLIPWIVLRQRAPLKEPGRVAPTSATPPGPDDSRASRTQQSSQLADHHSPLRAVITWAAIPTTAFVVWCPWLVSLQDKGGYAAVRENHRGFFVGWAGWLSSFQRQWSNLELLEGVPSCHLLVLALVVVLVYKVSVERRFTWNMLLGNRVLYIAVAGLAGLTAVFGPTMTLAVITPAGLGVSLLAGRESARRRTSRLSLAAWMLAAWFCGLSLTTPLYAPYVRLTLPWLMAAWLGAGAAIEFLAFLIDATTDEALSSARDSLSRIWSSRFLLARTGMLAVTVGFLAGLGWLEARVFRLGVPGWEPRTGVANAARQIVALAADPSRQPPFESEAADPPDIGYVVYTYGEPAMLFQLRLAGAEIVRPVMDLAFAAPEARPPKVPTYLVTGSHARDGKVFASQLVEVESALVEIDQVVYEPGRVVTADERGDRSEIGVFSVYRVR